MMSVWPTTPALPATLNVPVAARVISFIQPPPTGIVPIAVLYQPGNAASETEASDVEEALPRGLAIGRARLRIRRVPVWNLEQLNGVRAAFVTTGLRAHHDAIAAAAAAESILTISADSACVTSGRCVVGISNTRRTEITVNKLAARRSGIRFSSAFLMLVKEL